MTARKPILGDDSDGKEIAHRMSGWCGDSWTCHHSPTARIANRRHLENVQNLKVRSDVRTIAFLALRRFWDLPRSLLVAPRLLPVTE
jgi:hypothetical protein